MSATAYKRMVAALLKDLGSAPSELQRRLAESFAAVTLATDQLAAALVAGEDIDIGEYSRLLAQQLQLAEALGIGKPVRPSPRSRPSSSARTRPARCGKRRSAKWSARRYQTMPRPLPTDGGSGKRHADPTRSPRVRSNPSPSTRWRRSSHTGPSAAALPADATIPTTTPTNPNPRSHPSLPALSPIRKANRACLIFARWRRRGCAMTRKA